MEETNHYLSPVTSIVHSVITYRNLKTLQTLHCRCRRIISSVSICGAVCWRLLWTLSTFCEWSNLWKQGNEKLLVFNKMLALKLRSMLTRDPQHRKKRICWVFFINVISRSWEFNFCTIDSISHTVGTTSRIKLEFEMQPGWKSRWKKVAEKTFHAEQKTTFTSMLTLNKNNFRFTAYIEMIDAKNRRKCCWNFLHTKNFVGMIKSHVTHKKNLQRDAKVTSQGVAIQRLLARIRSSPMTTTIIDFTAIACIWLGLLFPD